jgi:hypothetical protein
MQLITATAKGQARSVTTKYGDRLVLDALGNDGKEYTIWRPGTDSQLPKIGNGERISLGVDSKGKCHLLDTLADKVATTTGMATTSTPFPNLDKETKQAIAAYIEETGSLYSFCYSTASNKLAEAPNEAKQAMASSLFIAAQRKFGLA